MTTHHEHTTNTTRDADPDAYEAPAIDSTVEVAALMTWGGNKDWHGGGSGGHHS